LRPKVGQIKVPVMGMFGDHDNIVDPRQWQVLKGCLPGSHIERYPKAGHFIMLDEPPLFMQKLKEFLDEPATST
jgi:pimeloyl-ACP methyl ester carboxylesterase